MENSQLLVIVAVAMVAAIILLRLYAVLGRRTGNERDPQERFRRISEVPQGKPSDNVVALPDRSAGRNDPIPGTAPHAAGLIGIKLADRNFETDRFLAGAQKAHEMIVTAFAGGDRAALKPLLSEEVFAAFDHVMSERVARHETVKFTVVGYQNVTITEASLKGRTAEITVAFPFQYISSTTDMGGALVDGDPADVRTTTDLWTFSRDIGARDPNWTLIATAGHEA